MSKDKEPWGETPFDQPMAIRRDQFPLLSGQVTPIDGGAFLGGGHLGGGFGGNSGNLEGSFLWSRGELLGGRYRLGCLLGQGGMGEVYEAFDTRRDDARVAVKRMFTADPAALIRLKREYRRMEGIGHPNLVALHGLAEHGGRPFIVMEYLEGRDFYASLAPRGSLNDLPRLRRLLRSLVAGMLALHDAGRVHRDLKGSNVLVTPRDRVVILDFGLVNDLERRTAITSTLGRIEGTAQYMSPEQAAGQRTTVSADWYALGVMLYRATTGTYPITGDPCQMILNKQTVEAPRAALVEPDVPSDLDELIARLLHREPDHRAAAFDVLNWCERNSDRPVRPGIASPRPIVIRSLIGREREQRALVAALTRFFERVPLRVDIVGASGTGKTALLDQFVATLCQDSGFVVLNSCCHEYDSVPFKAFDGLIDTLGRYLARLPAAEVEPLLDDGFRVLQRLFPTLRQVRDFSGPEAMFERLGVHESPLEPQALRKRAFQALRGLLHRLAAGTRLVLVVDNLQWGDLDSARLLTELMAPPSAPPLMFLCAYRNENVEQSPMLRELVVPQVRTGSQHEVVQIEVTALSLVEGAELARRLLGAAATPARAQAIAIESQGNPMLLTAIVRYLGGSEEELDASTRVTLARQRLSVEQLAIHRLGSLGIDATALLAAIAVAGQPTDFDVLARVAELQDDARAALSHLRAAALVRTNHDVVEVYHPEIGRALRQHLIPTQLVRLHRRLAEALGPKSEPERLALHWKGAGDLRRACEAAKDAAESALRTFAFERACMLLRLASECAPDDFEVQLMLANALRSAGQIAKAIPLLQGLSERARSPSKAREYRRKAGEYLLICGRRTQGLIVLAPLWAELGFDYPDCDRAAQARMKNALSQLVARGLTWTERSEFELPSRDVERYELRWTLCTGLILTDIVRGGLFAIESAALALELGEPKRLARSLALAGAVVLEHGMTEGRTWLKAAGQVAKRVGDEEGLGFTAICWGVVLRGRGAWTEALAELEFGLRRMPASAAWEQSLAVASQLACLDALGELGALRLRSLQVEKLGQEIGSARVLGLGLVYRAFTALAGGDVQLCRSLLAEARVTDCGEEAGIVRLYALKVEVECQLYAGDPATAWHRVTAEWSALERSRLLDVGLRRFVALGTRARAGLAMQASGAECPDHVGEVVAQDIARLELEVSDHTTPTVNLLRAGVAALAGDMRADSLLQAAAAGFDASGMVLHANCVRWILARRARADAELARAEAMMRLQGIADPHQWAHVLIAGVIDS